MDEINRAAVEESALNIIRQKNLSKEDLEILLAGANTYTLYLEGLCYSADEQLEELTALFDESIQVIEKLRIACEGQRVMMKESFGLVEEAIARHKASVIAWQHRHQKATKEALANNSSKGGLAKSASLEDVRAFCKSLYIEQPGNKKHQTKLKAIRDRVIAYAKERGHSLSYDQFITTASGWVSDIRETKAE